MIVNFKLNGVAFNIATVQVIKKSKQIQKDNTELPSIVFLYQDRVEVAVFGTELNRDNAYETILAKISSITL